MKKIICLLPLLASMYSYAQRDDMGFDFDNTALPTEVQSLSDWSAVPSASDDFDYTDKTDSKFTSTWDEAYNPDPGFVGPGQTRWVTTDPNTPNDANAILVNNGNLEIRAFPGGSNTDPDGTITNFTDRFVNCGIVSSKNTVTYPLYMEAKIKIANIENSSNFWMLNECDNEEIDVLECYGGAKNRDASGNVTSGDATFYTRQMSTNFHIWHRVGGQDHGAPSGTDNCGGKDLTDFTYQTFFTTNPSDANFNSNATDNWRDAFHTFGVLWLSPTDIRYYIDGIPRNNGSHFVPLREASNLTGSLATARLQCPNAAVLNCATTDLLADVQGQSGGGVPYPNRQFDDPSFIILDTESHAGRPLESITNLNDNSLNVTLVDWVRVYTPDTPINVQNRTRSISFDNRADFIPNGGTTPQFEIGETVGLDITYQTGINDGVEEDLDFVAVQILETDENGDRVALGPFVTVVPGSGDNMGQVQNFQITIPSNYARTGDNSAAFTGPIPTMTELDAGHNLELLVFVSVDSFAGFANADTDIILTSNTLSTANPLSTTEVILSPNPFSSEFEINSEINEAWKLYDLNGKIVATGTGNIVNGDALTSGIYLLSVNGSTIKVIKE